MSILRLALVFLAGFSVLHGQSTNTAGSVASVSLDNTQPGLTLSPILVGSGLYPSQGDGIPEYFEDDSYFIGEIRYFTGNTTFGQFAPRTDGSLINITANTALFSIVGTQFGGDGESNFAVPDLRGRTARHPAGGEFSGDFSGAEGKTLTASHLPAHSHGYGVLQSGQAAAVSVDNRQPSLNVRHMINGRGEIRIFTGNFAPLGWAFCEGQILNVAEFPDLASYVGNTFGGDGINTFALPDLRGRAILGTGQGPSLTNRTLGPVGTDAQTLVEAQIPAHTHGLPGGGATSSRGAASPSPISNLQASHGLTFAIVTVGIYPSFDSNPFAVGDRVMGEILIYATTNLPSGMLPCDGRLLQISAHSALYSLIGTTYGGNGSSNFALPDLRGRVPAGRGAGTGLTSRNLGDQFGIEQSTLLTSQLPIHSHSLPAAAGAIPNPGFEANTFGLFPGYAGGANGSISGWSHAGGAGLNPAGSSPFANNGTVPQGSKVAFIQSNTNTAASLSTTVYGLVPGTTYTVGFRTNSREGYAVPGVSWSVNGSGLIPCVSSPVGATSAYHAVTGTFTATSPLATITLQNQSATDTAVLRVDFTLTAGTSPAWSVSAWTGDASTGLTPIRTLWASLFNSSATTTVNEVPVTGVTGLSPAAPGQFSVSGFAHTYPNDTNALTPGTGGSSAIASNFLYGADPGTITLQGLTPGVSYRATFLSVGWDEVPDTRVVTLGSPNDSLTVDQNSYGNNNGIRLDHNFTATAATHTLNLKPASTTNTFHLYALALSVRDTVLAADWKQQEFGGSSSNPVIAGDNADPDGDGQDNLLEYALLSEPLSTNLVAFAAAVPVTLPGPVEARRFTFPYRPNSKDLNYVLQRSDNLDTWTDTYRLNLATSTVTQITGVSGSTDASNQTVTVTITDLSLFDTPYFWRLKAEAP